MFSSSSPPSTFPPLSLLPHSQQSLFIHPVTYYHSSCLPSHLPFSPCWNGHFFIPLHSLPLPLFPLFDSSSPSVALPPSCFDTCCSPSHFPYHSPLFFTYCGPMANFIYVLMIKQSLKHLLCEDLTTLVLSVFPQGVVLMHTKNLAR